MGGVCSQNPLRKIQKKFIKQTVRAVFFYIITCVKAS